MNHRQLQVKSNDGFSKRAPKKHPAHDPAVPFPSLTLVPFVSAAMLLTRS